MAQPPANMPQQQSNDPATLKAREALEDASQRLQTASQGFQQGLISRMQLKARVEECLGRKCDPMKSKAEAMAKRLGLD